MGFLLSFFDTQRVGLGPPNPPGSILFDTQRVGLGPPNPPGSILFRPTPFLILVRPTPFRYWFAQLGPRFVFLSTGSPNGSGGVSDFF